jgi:bifunctional DNA-binding transcriptional regulator/antitoxin component of YhaV-PrlF toxin-antitoxin module
LKTFHSKLEKFDSPVYGYHFKVPEDIARQFIEGNNRRVICDFSGQEQIQCAIMPSSEGWYILMNKTLREKLNLKNGQEFEVKIEKDHSEFGMEVPEELAVMLEQEETAKSVFDSLTPGKQRALIYIVSKVKNTDSRIRKALAIAEHLKECNGTIDFKRLNILIKQYNNTRL